VIDTGAVPVPEEPGNYDDPQIAGPPRRTLRPIAITQPDGPSFAVTPDGRMTWEHWTFQIGFDAREGLVLRQIAIEDGGRRRPVVHRASIAEMVVPYGDPSPVRSWQNYFDTGEYLVGRFANSLALGCDCLGEITYLDATIADDLGNPKVIPNAVCIHEEDQGILWKHSDFWTGVAQTRRQRRLVVSFFTTVGNYDYGFYWYFTLDGTISFEVKATGIPFTSAYRGNGAEYATEVAPGLGAPFHQHLFSARLDMTVDGVSNAVDEIEVERVPVGAGNERGNAFTYSRTRLRRESEAQRTADNAAGRVWQISNPQSRNRLGRPVAYELRPHGAPLLLADPASSISRRAGFATRSLWVTRFDESERYSAGDFVNQHHGGSGLPAYAAADRDIDGTDIVVWHTFGLTHFPRPEDWPIMPVDTAGFTLRPVGFFDRNPTLDVP
jgi:primary-amine oxidase